MTFTPTPKADLWTTEQLYDAWVGVIQQVLSRQHHSQAAQDVFAANIADLYSRLPGAGSTWLWAGTDPTVDPGMGRLSVVIIAGTSRIITISKTDADGGTQALSIAPGSTVVLTDDPSTPPTTAFRQYVVASNVTDHGTWISFDAVRVSTFGTQDTPDVDSRVRLLVR